MKQELYFKNPSVLLKYVFEVYCRCKTENFEWEENEFITYIDNSLNQLKENDFDMIVSEFLNNNDKGWWKKSYSKATYYRKKRHAMRTFIDCLIG